MLSMRALPIALMSLLLLLSPPSALATCQGVPNLGEYCVVVRNGGANDTQVLVSHQYLVLPYKYAEVGTYSNGAGAEGGMGDTFLPGDMPNFYARAGYVEPDASCFLPVSVVGVTLCVLSQIPRAEIHFYTVHYDTLS